MDDVGMTRVSADAEQLVQITLLGEAIEFLPVAVFVFDEVGRYVAVNEHASRITGYTRKELLGKRLGQLADESAVALAAYGSGGRPRERGFDAGPAERRHGRRAAVPRRPDDHRRHPLLRRGRLGSRVARLGRELPARRGDVASSRQSHSRDEAALHQRVAERLDRSA